MREIEDGFDDAEQTFFTLAMVKKEFVIRNYSWRQKEFSLA